jgi:antitoxin ParD1/3/4
VHTWPLLFVHQIPTYLRLCNEAEQCVATGVLVAFRVMAYYANRSADGIVMPTRNIVLTDHQENLLERLVSSGRYQNASEVLREGLRLVEQQEAEDKARLKALREAARIGIADVESGRVRDFTSNRELRAHLDSLTQRTLARSRGR